MKAIHPYINFAGNTEEAFNFYRSVFGGDFSEFIRYRDMPMDGFEIPEKDLDKIMHVSLPLGKDTILMATDTLESLGQKLVQGNHSYILLAVESREEADTIFEKLSAGGVVEMPMNEVQWGSYYGAFKDKFGIQWMVDYALPR